jgi:thiol:disulfide interchange protein
MKWSAIILFLALRVLLAVFALGFVATVAAALLGGCRSPATDSAEPDEFLREPATPRPAPRSYDDARALAKSLNKPLFVYFGASWCAPCREMQSVTLADQSVQARLADFVVWHVDVDADRATAKLYRLNSVPTYLIATAEGWEFRRGEGYRGPGDLLMWLAASDR